MAQVTDAEVTSTQGEGSGNNVRLIINALFDAALTKNSGPTPPPDTRPNMEWRDTTTNTLYIRDGTDTSWLVEKSFGKTTTPTASENELNGYPQGSEWFMDSRVFKHLGGGVWAEIGEAQAASLFAPTIGVLGGRRFAGSSDGTINSVVNGGPRFALGASAPTPVPDRYTYGLIPSVRFPITAVSFDETATDPTYETINLCTYIQVPSTATGYIIFDVPILTAPTYLNLKIIHHLSSGSAGSLTWNVSTSRLIDMGNITFTTPVTSTLTTSATNIRQTTHILLNAAGAAIGDVLRVRVNRMSGGTAGTVLITDFIIEQNP